MLSDVFFGPGLVARQVGADRHNGELLHFLSKDEGSSLLIFAGRIL
jgi:hypothetical protein